MKTFSRRFPAIATRLTLSALATSAGILSLALVHAVFTSLNASQRQRLAPDPIVLSSPDRPAAPRVPIEAPWPRHPLASLGSIHGSVLNGVRLVTEEWDGQCSSDDALEYYRSQMTSRGWQVRTEASLGLDSDTLAAAANTRLLQDQGFVRKYEDIVGHTLVLGRGEWSMIVQTRPNPRRPHGTRVRITAASTPDILRFAVASLAEPSDSGQPRSATRPLRHVGRLGGEEHATSLSGSPDGPERAFGQALDALRRDRWRAMTRPETSRNAGYRAWLVRGNQHAVLSATRSPSGRGTTLAFTEMRPE